MVPSSPQAQDLVAQCQMWCELANTPPILTINEILDPDSFGRMLADMPTDFALLNGAQRQVLAALGHKEI